MKSIAIIFLLSALGLIVSSNAQSDALDHDRARLAVQAGDILPLRTILDQLSSTHPGDVIEVELESEHSTWVYEVKLLRPTGAVTKLYIDAKTGNILKEKNK